MATEGLRKRSGEALDVGSNGSLNGKMQKEKAPRQTGDIKHGALEQALRIAALAFYFLASCVRFATAFLFCCFELTTDLITASTLRSS